MTRYVKVPLYLDGFSSEMEPPETPFRRPGPDRRGLRFVYMTARSHPRWTRLLDPACGRPLLDDAQDLIQMGYSQLWIFEKRYAAPPQPLPPEGAPSSKEAADAWPRPEYPAGLERSDWGGRLFVVLRQPRPRTRTKDVVSYHTDEDEACRAADAYRRATRRRTVVGRMCGDLQWH